MIEEVKEKWGWVYKKKRGKEEFGGEWRFKVGNGLMGVERGGVRDE